MYFKVFFLFQLLCFCGSTNCPVHAARAVANRQALPFGVCPTGRVALSERHRCGHPALCERGRWRLPMLPLPNSPDSWDKPLQEKNKS